MKVTSSDLLAILRRFRVADDSNVPRHIEQVKQSNPSPTNQLISFRFNRNHYYVLFDESAEDDSSFIMRQIYTAKSDAEGVIMENPTSDLTTYGLPFKGKDAYLFQLVSGKQRLDILLAERHPEVSRSTWQKHIKAGHVRVGGEVQTSPKHEVTEHDVIAIDIPERADTSAQTLPILYIDDDVIVIDKPTGILTHSKGALNEEFTVADFFRRYSEVALDTNRPGIVHRLDRDTSGVMIGARTPEAFTLLKAQFADRKAKKTYAAVVAGRPAHDSAQIDLPIGRNPSAPSTFRVDASGKPAITDYEVVSSGAHRSLLTLRPQTGRTHQLRVHLHYLGTPIVGDRVYSGQPADRLYLHASELEVTKPGGQRQTFVSPVPASFEEAARA